MPQRTARRVIAAHAMHPAAGRRRGRAEIQPPRRHPVGIGAQDRAREQVPQVRAAPADVPARPGWRWSLRAARVRWTRRDNTRDRSPARTARSARRWRRCGPPCSRSGTWQYAQTVCLPAGARVGSKRLCCASSTNGRAGNPPPATSRSPAATSSRLPPRCTVPARRHASASPGDGSVQRVIHLEDPGPVRETLQLSPVRRRQLATRHLRRPPDAQVEQGRAGGRGVRAGGRSGGRSRSRRRVRATRPPARR